jgi:MFS family permease
MFKVAKNKRLLMWTIFIISMIQMPHLALSSGIELIKTDIFPERSLSEIQTMISLPNLISVATSILAAVLIRSRLVKKRTMVVTGISMLALTGIFAIMIHTQFWQLIMFSVIIGSGMGLFIPTSQSVMCDKFDDNERRFMGGLQFSFMNLGGIIMSVIGGVMTSLLWYGGYIMLLVTIPVAILAIVSLPKERTFSAAEQRSSVPQKRNKLPLDVYYYAGTVFVFTLIFNVTLSNLSTHLSSNHLGNSATAGITAAVMMAGGVFSGLFFDKLTSKFHDKMIAFAFFVVFIGLTLLNIFHTSLFMVFISIFINGMAVSMLLPQCLLSTSNIVDPSNSATATMYLSSIAPGSGGFLSPVVFTNITQLLVKDSTQFRYQFVGFVALGIGILLLLNTLRREKRQKMRPEAAA